MVLQMSVKFWILEFIMSNINTTTLATTLTLTLITILLQTSANMVAVMHSSRKPARIFSNFPIILYSALSHTYTVHMKKKKKQQIRRTTITRTSKFTD